jgi:hypothetical protein
MPGPRGSFAGCCPDRGFRLPLAARAGAHPMIAVAELSGPRFQRKAERQKPTQENDLRMNPNIPNDTNYCQLTEPQWLSV